MDETMCSFEGIMKEKELQPSGWSFFAFRKVYPIKQKCLTGMCMD